VSSSISILLAIQHVSLILKVEDVLVMSYKQTFWTYWILLTIIAGLLILFIIFLLSNSYILCVIAFTRRCPEKSVQSYFVIVSLATIFFGSFFYVFGMLLMNLYNFLDSNRKSAYNPVFHYVAIGWLALMTIVMRLLSDWFALIKKNSAHQCYDGVRGERVFCKQVSSTEI